MGLHNDKIITGKHKKAAAPGGAVLALNQRAKRTFDIVGSAVGLVLLAPILLITSVAIKLSSRGPILIRQSRYGHGNRAIQVFKFRSWDVCTDGYGTKPRANWVGRVLSQSGIDELPQLLNILRGEMSIVGPRPYRSPQDLSEYCSQHSLPLLNCVKPGMISWAQTSDCGGELRTAGQRIDDDLHYAANWSLFFDLKIILKALFAEQSAADRRLQRMSSRF